MTTPNKLRLAQGRITLADGADPTEYLRQWAADAGVTADEPVCVLRRSDLVALLADAGARSDLRFALAS